MIARIPTRVTNFDISLFDVSPSVVAHDWRGDVDLDRLAEAPRAITAAP